MKSRIVYLTFLSAMLWLPIYIHPTEVFDMIAGTSVGALMAFALVGGKACNSGRPNRSVRFGVRPNWEVRRGSVVRPNWWFSEPKPNRTKSLHKSQFLLMKEYQTKNLGQN